MATTAATSLPNCGYTWDVLTCGERGAHHCRPRADKAVGFFRDILVHTKGRWARRQFILEPWQEHEIVRPLFGEVVWSSEWQDYIRRYTVFYEEVARKNGKSELAAGLALLGMIADDEEAAEVYGGARDTKQAGKVWEVAERMVKLSPTLRQRIKINRNARRLFDEQTASYYEMITRDAAGELGHNPHVFILDEVITQADGSLYEAMKTAAGARTQPLFVLLTTAGNDPLGFAGRLHNEMVKVAEDSRRAPHVLTFIRNTPMDADPWDESNWPQANPALGSFLSIEALRREALEARNDPSLENAFRQFRLNQWVQQTTRWMPLHLWDQSHPKLMVVEDQLVGATAFGGLDLSATTDLAALAWWFPNLETAVWRYWAPEAMVVSYDEWTGGQFSQWIRDGYVTVTEGDAVDYEVIHRQVEKDASTFAVAEIGVDRWNAQATFNHLDRLEIPAVALPQGYALSGALKEVMRLVKGRQLNHGGNPVTRWNVDAADVKKSDEERIKLVKPDRQTTSKRIDGLAALSMAVDRWIAFQQQPTPVASDLIVL